VAAVVVVAAAALLVLALSADDPSQVESGDGEARAEPGDGLPQPVSQELREMSTARKVAQLMLVGMEGTDAGDPVFSSLEERDYAGLVLTDQNYVSSDQVGALAAEAGSVAEDANHVAPLVVAPQEGGEFNAFADLPPDDAAADLDSPRQAAQEAEAAAEEFEEIGVTGILGPVLDVGSESGGALGERLYSDEPDAVREYGLATIEEFDEAGLFTAAKHFPGLGAASQSPEFGTANVGLSPDELAQRDLVPFEAAIDESVPGILVGHGLYEVDDFVTPASMSKTVMIDLLRGDLGFDGVAIADDLTSPAVTSGFTPGDAAVESVRSGADLVYVSVDDEQQGRVYEALLDAVRGDRITAERLDEAVTRTLMAKEKVGLLEEEGSGGPERRAGKERGA
jgi:beta-N-acetylhexosaminidase